MEQTRTDSTLLVVSLALGGALLAMAVVLLRTPLVVLFAGVVVAAAMIARISRQPELGVYLFIFTYPMTSLSLSEEVVTLSLSNVLLLVTSCALLFKVMAVKNYSGDVGPVIRFSYALMPLFLITVIPAILIAPNFWVAVRFLPTRIGYLLTFLVIVLLMRGSARMQRALKALVASASLACAATLVTLLFPGLLPADLRYLTELAEPLLDTLSLARPTGLFLSAQTFASWSVLAFPGAVLFALKPRVFGVPRSLGWLAVFLIVMGLLVNQTRAAWIAVLLQVLLLLCLAPLLLAGKKKIAIATTAAVLAVLLVTVLLAWAVLPEIVDSVLYDRGRLGATEERFIQFETAYEVLRSHPWFGLGPFGIDILYLQPAGIHYVHNQFLQELAYVGVVGFLPYFAFLPLALYAPVKLLLRRTSEQVRLMAGALVLGGLGALVVYQTYPSAGEKSYWIMLGLCAATSQFLYAPAQQSTLQPGSPALRTAPSA